MYLYLCIYVHVCIYMYIFSVRVCACSVDCLPGIHRCYDNVTAAVIVNVVYHTYPTDLFHIEIKKTIICNYI